MTAPYRVILAPAAALDLRAIDEYISRSSTDAAEAFLGKMHRRIASPATTPRRGGPAREASVTGRNLRQITFGRYRVVYTGTGRTVYVLRVGHTAREWLVIPPDPVDS